MTKDELLELCKKYNVTFLDVNYKNMKPEEFEEFLIAFKKDFDDWDNREEEKWIKKKKYRN